MSKARLIRGMNAGTMPSTLDRSTPRSREPEITRLAELHGFAVRRCGNRIRTHNSEVTDPLRSAKTGAHQNGPWIYVQDKRVNPSLDAREASFEVPFMSL